MTSYQTAIEAMPRLLDKDQNALETFNRKNYTASFLRRYQEFVPAFDAIEQLYHEVKEPEAMLHNMAQALTDSALSQMETLHRRGARDNALMNFNMQLAVFVYPAILYYKGDSSKPLTQAIQACWKEAFPEVDRKILSLRTCSLEEKFWFILIHLRLYHPVKRITGWFRNHRRSDS